jgi:hypothetical protein
MAEQQRKPMVVVNPIPQTRTGNIHGSMAEQQSKPWRSIRSGAFRYLQAGALASSEEHPFFIVSLNKLEVLYPHYFNTGPTL